VFPCPAFFALFFHLSFVPLRTEWTLDVFSGNRCFRFFSFFQHVHLVLFFLESPLPSPAALGIVDRSRWIRPSSPISAAVGIFPFSIQ